MDDREHVDPTMGLGAPDFQDGALRAERVCELQERKQTLQAALSRRLGELRRICLLEAELTGKLPRDFPLELGERVPLIQRRIGLAQLTHTQDDPYQRRQMKALFGGALRRTIETDKRTVHRGCHTEETLRSESSSMSDSTSQDNESSPSVAPEQRSLSHPRLTPSSPDAPIRRKLSPVEIYYEMRTRRNSSSSVSPSHSLPRSTSNVEGHSVPATPLLSRTAPISIHVRSEVCSGGVALKQWCGSPDIPHFIPLASLEGSSSERRSCPYGSRARRSNSSEALLDRSCLPSAGLPPRGAGPYKSSETLTDGKLRQYRGSPERHGREHGPELSRTRASVGGRPSGGGYNEILLDYIWGKAPQRPSHTTAAAQPGPRWSEGCPPHLNGLPPPQLPPYSPLLFRPAPPDPRRSKVTRTKSCGPFLPEPLLLSAYDPPHPPGRPPLSLPPPADGPMRGLHKALALEGLRDWYLRNALGHAPTRGHGHSAQTPPSQGEGLYPPLALGTHMTQSASFHGYPLQNRSVELSRFPESLQSQDEALTDPPTDNPAPGTLV